MSDKNAGKEFEKIVQAVFQEIQGQDFVRNVDVEHNINLSGKSGSSNQIDVYWEFEFGGINYSTIVQAKDWNTSVNQGEVQKLKGIIEDLPQQPKGIVVSKKGFQEGAITYAKHHGIELFTLAELPKPEPIKMTQGSFVEMSLNAEKRCFETTVFPIRYKNVLPHYKTNWLRKKSKGLNIQSLLKGVWQKGIYDTEIFNLNHNKVGTFIELFTEEITDFREKAQAELSVGETLNKKYRRTLRTITYLATQNTFLPFVRLRGIDFTCEIGKDEKQETKFSKPGITRFIFENVISEHKREVDIKKK